MIEEEIYEALKKAGIKIKFGTNNNFDDELLTTFDFVPVKGGGYRKGDIIIIPIEIKAVVMSTQYKSTKDIAAFPKLTQAIAHAHFLQHE